MTIQHGAVAPTDTRAETAKHERTSPSVTATAIKPQRTPPLLATARAPKQVPPESRAQISPRERIDHSATELIAHYHRLPQTDSVYKFVSARLNTLLSDFKIDNKPELIVLARKGFGINACATPDGAVIISPEMLAFLKYVEELDYVLLHEVQHLAGKHHEKQEASKDSLMGAAGQGRISEYDADLAAFVALAHPARNSSPMGAIVALERFNQEAPTAWDVAHGTLVDRIMNLKWLTLFKDLSTEGAIPGESGSLSKPLRRMPAFIAAAVETLPAGSRVESLLKRPPPDRGYDAYRAELREAIAASEISSLRWALPHLCKDLKLCTGQSASAKFLRESYAEAVHLIFSKLFDEVAATSQRHDLSPASARQLLGAELMLCGITTEGARENLRGPLQKRVISSLEQFQSGLSSQGDVETLCRIVPLLEGNVAPEQTKRFIFEVGRAALVDNCVFDRDEDETIDIEGYLSQFHDLATAIAPLTLTRLSDAQEFETILHAQSFLQLATHLLDIESPQLDDAIRHSNENKSGFLEDPAAVSVSLQFLGELVPDSSLMQRLSEFSRERLKLLSIDDSKAQLRELFRNTAPLISRIVTPEDAPAALSQIKNKFQDAYHAAKSLPNYLHSSVGTISKAAFVESIYNEEIRRDDAAIENAPLEHAMTFMLLKAGFLHTLCQYAEQRDHVSARIDEGLRLVGPRFEVLVDFMNELRSERPESLIRGESLPPRHGNPNETIGIHEAIFQSLYEELFNVTTPLSSERVLERLYTFATLTAIVAPEENSATSPHLEILNLGVQALQEVYREDKSSEQFLKHALAVSFFDPNQVSARPIQRGLAIRLIEAMGAERAAKELFENFRPHRQWHSLEALERLDETAGTTTEIKNVATLSKDHLLAADQIADRAGSAVLADLIMSNTGRWDSFEFLFTGLSTAENDKALTEMLSQRWWTAQAETLLAPLRREDLPEPGQFKVDPERRDTAEAFLENVSRLTPVTFTAVHPLDATVFSTPETITARTVRSGLYGLGMGERLVVLRKLANDPTRGVLISPERRERVADGLINMMLGDSQSDKLTQLSSQAFFALFRAVPADDLGIAITPMLLDHFLRAPRRSASFKPFAEEKAHHFLEEFGWDADDLHPSSLGPSKRKQEMASFYQRAHNEISRHLEWALSGRDPKTKQSISESVDTLMNVCDINLSDHKSLSRRGAIPFILDFSRNLQTPGTRALQLLGGVVELPPEIEREFLQVYDARKGQSKQSALNTIEKTVPNFAAELHSLQRIGGGALYSVFLAALKDGTREVLRVANPNPQYHTERILHSMRAAQAQLERENADFAIGAHVINLVDEWISSELKDTTFESDDKLFRSQWNNWRPERSCPLSIHVPHSHPTGSLLVRREEFIPGRNFTELEQIYREDPALARNAVALALRHYTAQIEGSWYNLGERLVHSDISPGNLRLMDGGKVAILDRSMFLRFSLEDRMALKRMREAESSSKDLATSMVDGLAKLQTRKFSTAEKAQIAERVAEALKSSSSQENNFMKGFLIAQREGLMVPLRFQLLVKNFNSFRVMAQKVGFASLKEAQEHRWGK